MINLLRYYSFFVAFVFSTISFAQSKAKDYIIEGNNYYENGKFDNAEYAYKRAALEDPTSVKANYNLGNALYKQKRYKESISHYNRSAEVATSKVDKHSALHNAGNAYLEEQDYEKAVESFKNALKNDPHDESTRYNLAYAKKMLEKQKQKDKNQSKDSSNKEDQKKDKENQQKQDQQKQKDQQKQDKNNNQNDENQENQADKNQREKDGGNPKNGGQNGNQKGDGNQQNPQITQGSKGEGSEQDNAPIGLGEGMLKALQEQEMRTQRRIIQQKADKQRSNTSKDW